MSISDHIRPALAFFAAMALLSAVGSAEATTINGHWLATVDLETGAVPFRLDLNNSGASASGTFFDGDHPTNPSRQGEFKAGHLHLVFPSYAATLDADLKDGVLDGAYVVAGRTLKIHAIKEVGGRNLVQGPAIAGEWILPFNSPKGEVAWRLIIHQKGGETQAAILRIDGDTGTLNGGYRDGAFHLSHFAGERPAKLEITPQSGDTLKVVLTDASGQKVLSALRPDKALAAGAVPTDPARHTTVQNPAEPLRYSFVDLSGRKVSNTDARFKHKVVIIDVMGSWCPNCHDETPFLEALYAKHRRDGLEIVALDFEQHDQLADPQRLRAFIQRYGVQYTVLLAGEPKDVNAKLPQAVNLNAWPTTFFVGRDGLVRSVHVGFTSPGSGRLNLETRAEAEHEVEKLLAER